MAMNPVWFRRGIIWLNEQSRCGSEVACEVGSTPISRTLTRRPIEAIRSVYVEAKEVQCGVQARCR